FGALAGRRWRRRFAVAAHRHAHDVAATVCAPGLRAVVRLAERADRVGAESGRFVARHDLELVADLETAAVDRADVIEHRDGHLAGVVAAADIAVPCDVHFLAAAIELDAPAAGAERGGAERDDEE